MLGKNVGQAKELVKRKITVITVDNNLLLMVILDSKFTLQ